MIKPSFFSSTRAPMAIKEEPDATRAAPFPASAAAAATAETAPAATAAEAGVDACEAWRQTALTVISEEARVTKGVRVPDGPDAAEKEAHYVGDVSLRAWCSYRTRAAAPDDPHHRYHSEPSRKPIVHMDYTFVTDPSLDMLTVLNIYDVELGMMNPTVVGEEGPIQYSIRSACEHLTYWGRKAIILRVDGEPAIKALRPSALPGRRPRSSR